jgi:hypothetical protein
VTGEVGLLVDAASDDEVLPATVEEEAVVDDDVGVEEPQAPRPRVASTATADAGISPRLLSLLNVVLRWSMSPGISAKLGAASKPAVNGR